MADISLTGTFRARADGTPAKGRVTFKLTDEIRDGSGDLISPRVRHTSNLNNGAFTISLPVASGGSGYAVVEKIEGAEDRSYTITIPASPSSQTLAEVQ